MGKWEEVELSEVCSFENGDRGKNYPSKKAYREKGIPFYSTGNIKDNRIDDNSINFISRNRFDKLGSGKVKKGDFLFCLRGSLGKFAIIENESDGGIASSLVIVRPSKLIKKGFLNFYLQSDLCAAMIKNYDNGSAQPNLSSASLKKFVIPLPPLPEQERIVAKLDGLFEKIDRAIGLLEENIAHTEALMGSVLDEELSGNNYDFGKWKLKTWKEVLDVNNGKNQKQVQNINGKYPIYGSGGLMNYADDYLCKEDSVIIGRKGTINKPIYVDTKFWNVDTAFGLTPKENLLPRYLYFFCVHFNFMSLNKSTTLPSLAKRDLLKVEINLPPIEIQNKILKKLENVNNFKDKIIKAQTEKLTHLKSLKSSLLDQAFKEEL